MSQEKTKDGAGFGNTQGISALDLEFRPRKFSEVCGNQEIISMLESYIESDSLPQVVLLYGQPGMAKTTLSFILTAALLCTGRQAGEHEPCGNCWSCMSIAESLYVNGTAIRGMNVHTFNMSSHETSDAYIKYISSVMDMGAGSDGRKVIILEELHKAPLDQQESLNNILEFPPKGVYTIICTSSIRKVAKAIQKRALSIPLNSPDSESLVKYLRKICFDKQQSVSDTTLKKIIKAANNNGRQSVKLLQSVFETGDLAVDAIINHNAVQIDLYLQYFSAVRLGVLPIMEFIEDTLKEPAIFFSGLDDYIYTVLKTRYSASFVMDKDMRKSIKETMTYFPDPVLINIMKYIKGAGYIADDDARKALFVIGFDANPKIEETLEYSDSQNYAIAGGNTVDESDDLISDNSLSQFNVAFQQAFGSVNVDDL